MLCELFRYLCLTSEVLIFRVAELMESASYRPWPWVLVSMPV